MRFVFFLLMCLPIFAATNRTVTVKPSGGDYTSLAAAVAGESKNLVSLDRQLTIECYAMADTAAVVFDRTAWTTDATRYILVTVPVGQRHNGSWSTSAYRMVMTNNAAIQVHHGVFLIVEWVQLHVSAGDNRVFYHGGATNSASNITIRNSILRTNSAMTSNGVVHGSFTGNASTNIYVYNNLIYGSTGSNAYGVQIDVPGTVRIWNNTIVGMFGGLNLNNNGQFLAQNNLIDVTTTAARGYTNYMSGSGYNSTTRSSMDYTVTGGATGDRVSQTFTFVNSGAGDYHLAEGDGGAKDFGLSNPSGSGVFVNDIDGESRNGAWDIGADEYPSSTSKRRYVIASIKRVN